MNKFEAVSGGNIATTPIKNVAPIMSPTEKAAFAAPEETPSGSETLAETSAQSSTWEVLEDKKWSDSRLGENISNKFQRVTSRMKVPGGHMYLVSTYVMTYVRGVSDSSVAETMQFVPDSCSAKTEGKTKK